MPKWRRGTTDSLQDHTYYRPGSKPTAQDQIKNVEITPKMAKLRTTHDAERQDQLNAAQEGKSCTRPRAHGPCSRPHGPCSRIIGGAVVRQRAHVGSRCLKGVRAPRRTRVVFTAKPQFRVPRVQLHAKPLSETRGM